ncbi:MAG: hypothetical protein CME85_03515 [Henriciella sp.]|nr:hypothetical protein [Henriciella sp.]MBK74549.1 hypothetical protein [Henriciella sp.]
MAHPTPLNPSGTIKRSRTDAYEHTINGLLTKRADLFNEAERLRDRMAEIKNDVAALDRVLGTLGYSGDLDALMPRQKVVRLFGQGELLRACLHELRHAEEPLTSREIARNIVELRGDDPNDRKYLSDMTRRISKCLRKEREAGHVVAHQHSGKALVWAFATA